MIDQNKIQIYSRILQLKHQQFLFMQVDQRYLQNIQNENVYLRQEIGKLNGALGALDEKYQRSLKQMSSIIHANQNLKNQLDSIKGGIKDQIQNSVKEVRATYQKRIEQIMRQKDDVNVHNQNLIRQKEQIQRDYTNIQQNMWQLQALKKEVTSLKKQNQKLLLQTHPLTQNQQNPQQKSVQHKFSQKIEQLNNKIAELNVMNTQSKKYGQFVQQQKQKLFKQNQDLQKKITQLNSTLQANTLKSKEDKTDANDRDGKRYQLEALELRKHNADLTNQIQRLKLQKLEMSSQINKNQAEMHLLSTLRSLHSQLQPMRFEVQQLKRDKYYERENGNKQKAQLQTKYLSTQHELQSLKQHIKDVEGKNKELSQQIRQKQWQKHKIQDIEQEKRILEGRVIVYEAMEMVTRNRDKPHHVERIQEFQRRIQLLLQEQNLKYLVNNANVHQLIAMKAYVIQLDNKLQVVAEQNQHLLKKYSQYKERYQQMVAENKQIINKHYAMTSAYKGKISGYEKLVLKLTQQLDRYLKDNQNSTIESHYKSVITLYQSKIMSIHNQINAKKQQNRDWLKKYQNVQLQLKGKLALIRELELEISNLKTKLKETTTKLSARTLDEQTRNSSPINNIPQDHYKGIISQKTKEILELEENLSKLKLKLDKAQFEYDRQLDSLKYKINRLEIQNQHLRLEQSENQKHMSTSKHSEQLGQLVQKMANIERNINAISKSQVNLQPMGQSKQLINLQYEKQIQMLRHENQYLSKQLERLRNEQKRQISGQNISMVKGQMNYQQYIQKLRDQSQRNILSLQRRILQLQSELKIKSKQLEIKQRSSFGQSQISIQQPITQTHHLQQQNQQLRTQLSRIKSSSRVMNTQSQDLMRKIRQMELYTRQLKEQFQNVGSKMGEYQRQIGLKDNTIYELRFKITHLQQQHEFELENMKNSAHNTNDRHLLDRERKINDAEAELDRLAKKLEMKSRDIERLQIQMNRKSSQIEIMDRDARDKIRRIQQRERQLSEEQRRLVILSQEISNRQKNIPIQPPQPTINPYLIQQLKSQIDELDRKLRRLQQELGQKNKIIQALQQKEVRFIREKSGLLQQLELIKPTYEQLQRNYQFNLKQIGVYKQQVARVQGELQSLWRDYDMLKQQLRSRQRTIDDKQLELEELKTKYEIQIRQLNQKISQIQYSTHITHIETPSPIKPPVQSNQNLKYKAEIERLTRQLQNISRQYDNIRQQLRNKDKMLNDMQYQKQQVQRKYEIQIRQINQKIRVLESSKNQHHFNPVPTHVIERPSHQYNQRQIDVYKQENIRLEAQLDKLWREFDTIKMQLRNKQRQLNDAIFDREQMQRKLQLQKKQYKQTIRELENSQVIASPGPKSPEKGIDYRQIQRQFQERIRKIEQQSRQKIRQVYKENEQNTRELQQTISDLTSDLKRMKMQSLSPGGNKELDAHTNAIQSLEAHLSSLEQEIKRKSIIISQLQEDLNYYKDQLNKREQEIQKLYESTYLSSSHAEQNANQLANAQKIRLQNQIISLQNVIQRQMQSYNHDECIKKQHYLRLQIERLNGILQSRSSLSNKQDGSHPISDNSYLLELEQNNKKLQQDLTILRQKLIHNFDTQRSIEEYLAILVITFAEVDALRQRIHELEQNFRQEHEREVNVLKQLDELKQKEVDVEKIMQILKELEMYHRAFHEQQQRSKSTFIRKINTQILVVPGTQTNNILDEINKNIQKSQQQHIIQSHEHSGSNPPTLITSGVTGPNNLTMPFSQNLGSVNLTSSFGLNRPYYPPTLDQTGFNLSGSPQKNIVNSNIGSNLGNSFGGGSINTGLVFGTSIGSSINQSYVPMPTNIPVQGGNLGAALGTGVSVGGTFSSGGSALNPVLGSQYNYRYGIFDKGRTQPIGSSGQFTFSQQQNQYTSSRPGSYSMIPQPLIPASNPIFQPPNNVQQNQVIQQQNVYQQGQVSHNSLKFPSQMAIQVPSSGLSLPHGIDNNQTPYMMSSTQLLR